VCILQDNIQELKRSEMLEEIVGRKVPWHCRCQPPPPPIILFIYKKYSTVHLTPSTKYPGATPRQISSDFSWFIVMDEVTVAYLTFRWPCIVRTLHVSDSYSVHHQGSSTVHTANVYTIQVMLTACSQAVSITSMIYTFAVCTVKNSW